MESELQELEMLMGNELYERFSKYRPGPQEDETRPEEKELERRKLLYLAKYKFNPLSPTMGIKVIHWSQVRHANFEENSHGLFYLTTESKKAFGVKSNKDVANIYFCYCIHHKLKLPTPELRVLQAGEVDFSSLHSACERVSRLDDNLQSIMKAYLEVHFLLFTQYIPSIRLLQVTGDRAKLLFGTSHLRGRERLTDVGRIIAADTFLNYSHRFPAIWEEVPPPQDMENLLIMINPDKVPMLELLDDKDNPNIDLGDLYTINTRTSGFKKDTKISQMGTVSYLNCLERFIEDICVEIRVIMKGEVDISSYQFESIKVIKDYLNTTLMYDIGSLGCLEIIFGILIGYFNIVGMGLERLKRIHNHVRNISLRDWESEWHEMVDESISMEFLRESFELISYHLQLNVDVVSWVLKMTNNMKVIDVFDEEHEQGDTLKLDIDATFDLEFKQRKEDDLYKMKVEEEEEGERLRLEEEMKRRAELMLATPREEFVGEEDPFEEEFKASPVKEEDYLAAEEERAEELQEDPEEKEEEIPSRPKEEKKSGCCVIF